MSKRLQSERTSSNSSVESSPKTRQDKKKAKMPDSSAKESQAESFKGINEAICNLGTKMEANFTKLHSEVEGLRDHFSTELQGVKSNMKQIEKSLENVWEYIEDLKEDKKTQQEQIDEMKQQIESITKNVEEEKEKNIALEAYTRRENLRFMNVAEEEGEDCKAKILDILANELNIDTDEMRFHAVHRVGKKHSGRRGPRAIIARFVVREDRDEVWARKKVLRESTRFKEVYITKDYARAVQLERKILLQAMAIAKNQGRQAKVIDRNLIVGNTRYNVHDLPLYLQPDR